MITQHTKTTGILMHLSALIGYWIPFANIIAPAVIWFLKSKEEDQDIDFVSSQAKSALNVQISLTIYIAVIAALCLLFIGTLRFAALPPVILTYCAYFIFILIGAQKANQGEVFESSIIIKFFK